MTSTSSSNGLPDIDIPLRHGKPRIHFGISLKLLLFNPKNFFFFFLKKKKKKKNFYNFYFF